MFMRRGFSLLPRRVLLWLPPILIGLPGVFLSGAESLPKKFDEAVARKFAAVAEWQGFWETSETRSFSKSNNMGYVNNAYEGSGHGHFVLQRGPNGWDPARGDFEWVGNGEAAGMRNETISSWSKSGPRMTGEDWRKYDGGQVVMKDVTFTIWMNRQHASVHAGGNLDGALKGKREGHAVVALSSGDGQHHYGEETIDETMPGSILTFSIPNYEKTKLKQWRVVQDGPGVLTFEHEERGHDATGGDSLRRSLVVMVPVYDDVEVEITIAGYAEWRPKGSIADPSKPGNALTARAVLKSKTGKTKVLPEVERFRFELLDTSREPGVCLNWPLGAKDEDYDLKFADLASGSSAEQLAAVRKFFSDWGMASSGDYDLANMPPGAIPRMSFAEVSEDGQKAELTEPPKDGTGHPFAEVAIESYDFGAKSELRVTCILKDGRELLGLMKGEGGEQDLVRLPKRAGPEWIAENWRKKNDVMNLAASDDDEKVDGQPLNGDGYTLYEEYRGWAVNGKHLEGDPKAKDFFVLNMIGADGRPGIELFEDLSKLRVHSKLRRGEMSQGERLMNGNHRDAPHRVDQHGVWVKTFTRSTLGDTGADTPMTKAGVAGRPGITKGVGILGRDNSESAFNKPYNLPAQDAIFAYDRAIAHELLHSVGVEHHGPPDTTRYALKFIPPNVPENKIGRPHYQTGDGTAFTVLQEDGHDLAAAIYVHYAEVIAKYRAVMMDMLVVLWSSGPAGSKDPKVARELAEASLRGAFDQVYEQRGLVGREHGEHSGDQDCVMRYYFARFYEAKSSKNTLYIVTPGTERIGMQICHSGAGTGINASSHQPQSRYGDAAAGEGDCFSQICPNDAIPPRKTKP